MCVDMRRWGATNNGGRVYWRVERYLCWDAVNTLYYYILDLLHDLYDIFIA